jgi:2-dehydro-3-deoxyphosphooctonate aldolase (KDO 8-P synthase)
MSVSWSIPSSEKSFFLFAGPCVIESESLVMDTAGQLDAIAKELNINFVFKASFDKANRSSLHSFRGPGLEKGLSILDKVRQTYQIPVITDVHETTPLDEVASVVDILQTPALLCRQTDFIQRVAATQKPVNIKKGQFLAPEQMSHVLEKAKATGNNQIMACERGTCFGYQNLVSDMRSLPILKQSRCPVVFDATHTVQLPGGLGQSSGGKREFVPVLARAAVAVGIDGLFMETHPNPDQALSDGPNSWPLHKMKELLQTLLALHATVRAAPNVLCEV